jgi:hypothetical protein
MYLVEENAGGIRWYPISSTFWRQNVRILPKRKGLGKSKPIALTNEFDVLFKLDLEEGVYELVICKYDDDVPTLFQHRYYGTFGTAVKSTHFCLLAKMDLNVSKKQKIQRVTSKA